MLAQGTCRLRTLKGCLSYVRYYGGRETTIRRAVPPAQVREAMLEDAAAIARVHVDSWRTSYQGIVPEGFLADMSYEEGLRGSLAWVVAERRGPALGLPRSRAAFGRDRRFRLRWPTAGHRVRRLCGKAVCPLSAERTPTRGDRTTTVWLGGTRPGRRGEHVTPGVGTDPQPLAALLRGRGRAAARKPGDRDRRGKARGSSLRLAGHRSRRLPWIG
jgi:hypothetical protein